RLHPDDLRAGLPRGAAADARRRRALGGRPTARRWPVIRCRGPRCTEAAVNVRTPDTARAPAGQPAPDAPVLLQTRALEKRFGGVIAVSQVDFTLHEGEIRCLIGPNGAGKSTFFKM